MTEPAPDPEVNDYPTYVRPRTSPRERFATIRRFVVFLLGVAVIIDALWDRSYVVPELIVGMILVGVLPIDEVLKDIRRRPRG